MNKTKLHSHYHTLPDIYLADETQDKWCFFRGYPELHLVATAEEMMHQTCLSGNDTYPDGILPQQ